MERILSPEQALESLVSNMGSIIEKETVLLHDATGRILCSDITAEVSVPNAPRSAMDGYAVRSEDIITASEGSPVMLKVIGEIFAGDVVSDSIRNTSDKSGTSVRIMTGGVIPDGYDTVVKQEDTDLGTDTVGIKRSQKSYVNYCRVGEDISEGTLVMKSGTRIGRAQAGILASLGLDQVDVYRRIRVAILSTGSEIVDVGSPLSEGKIYNSLSYTLASALYQPAFDVRTKSIPDDENILTEAVLTACRDSDIVITTGGVSVGKRDLIPEVLDRVGATKIFSHLRIKPGSPTIGSVKDHKVILSLSGNPYAAVANFDLYFWPVVAHMTGCDQYMPVIENARLVSDVPKASNVRRLMRAFVRGGEVTILSKGHESSVLSSLMDSNCYADLPEGHSLTKGDTVRVIRIPEVLI